MKCLTWLEGQATEDPQTQTNSLQWVLVAKENGRIASGWQGGAQELSATHHIHTHGDQTYLTSKQKQITKKFQFLQLCHLHRFLTGWGGGAIKAIKGKPDSH